MADNALSAELREGNGKGAARRLRATGRMPAVLYGRRHAAQSLAVDPTALSKLLHGAAGMNTLIQLTVAGATDTVLVKALQRDPVRGRYLHADFYQVDLTQKITVSVPIRLLGKAKGTELGGILDHPLREIAIECLPGSIPQAIEVDVSDLAVNQSIHVSDLRLPEGVTVKTEPTLAVASVVIPAAEEEATPAAAVEGEVPAEGAEAAEAAPAAEEGAAAAPKAEKAAKPEKGERAEKGAEKKK